MRISVAREVAGPWSLAAGMVVGTLWLWWLTVKTTPPPLDEVPMPERVSTPALATADTP